MRTADTIEQAKESKTPPANSAKAGKALPAAFVAHQFKPGQSGNPSGRPKRDFFAILAQHVIEGMTDDEYNGAIAGFRSSLRKGNAYVFKELSDRGYGKIPDKTELTGKDGAPVEFQGMDDNQLNEHITAIRQKLGITAVAGSGAVDPGDAATGGTPKGV